ncbi:MAG TPA: M28 family peptidase [Streptosporangiaceae bacterium]|nr:M28 family peptidase [Streptosporangiaceae bacterium]
MLRRITSSSLLALVACSGLAITAMAPGASGAAPAAAVATPGIDPGYIYRQLDHMVAHFQRREAGYRAGAAGHSGFATYWSSRMLGLLGPFGATARTFRFPVRGWYGRPATAPAADVEVTVPGLTRPAEQVVIGCHYDGEADSTESAYDDGSGCAIELGVAQAMAAFWRAHHVYPARTLRFVLFDAEEQGLFGSYEYVNKIARNNVRDITMMINEEQNGIAYPLRYLGKSSNPPMPLFAFLSPLSGNRVYRDYSVTRGQLAGLRRQRTLVKEAVAAAFRRYRAMGNQMLTYHAAAGADVWRPVFTPAEIGNVHVASDTLGSSDQVPFTQAGVRSATFVGNATYYQRRPPPGSYPYDQPQDTIGLMNVFADGGSAPSHALELALGLPGLLTTWLLSQPGILGQAAPDGRPVVAMADTGVVLPARQTAFSAVGAFVPGRPGETAAKLHYVWDFGDGHLAAGRIVHHAYRVAGAYRLRLLVRAGSGRPRVISKRLIVGPQPTFRNIYASALGNTANPIALAVAKGLPPHNPAVRLPVAAPGLRDKVGTVAQASCKGPVAARRGCATAGSPAPPSTGPGGLTWALSIIGGVLLLAALALVWRRVRR